MNRALLIAAAASVFLFASCADVAKRKTAINPAAHAEIEGREGTKVHGVATFSTEGDRVTLSLEMRGLPPGRHAVHLHEFGDCSAKDFKSAGEHWNPGEHDHGRFGVGPFHLGDVGNLQADENGDAQLSLSTQRWSVGSSERNDVLGRSIVIHDSEDDFETQPSGNAGGRIGCGVINPTMKLVMSSR